MVTENKRGNDKPKLSVSCILCAIVLLFATVTYFGYVSVFSNLKEQNIESNVSLKEIVIERKKEPLRNVTPTPITETLPKIEEIQSAEVQTEPIPLTPSSAIIATAQMSSVQDFENALKKHPLRQLTLEQLHSFQMEDYFEYLKKQPECQKLPIFISMGNVFSELYWQMIENFVYTMVKFDLSACSVMVCVSDPLCMQKCANSYFPCIDFTYTKFHPDNKHFPSPLEQIAALKLFHIPKALARKVDVIMVDLDVGFLSSPMNLIRMIKPNVDIYVQKDIAYVMNRTLEGWRTWYTIPLPNIGLFYVRGNTKTVDMFRLAWDEYKVITDTKTKNNPGKDQNKVAFAMRVSQGRGLNWDFFPASSAVLLDMVYKFNDPSYELGGEAAMTTLTPITAASKASKAASSNWKQNMIKKTRHHMSIYTKDVGAIHDDVYAIHTTCYEQKSKIMGLKAANAYWNPHYYQANKRTITKPIIYFTEDQLRHEIRSLVYLGVVTNRSVIIPNILGPDGKDIYQQKNLWPGFRVFFPKKSFQLPVEILEPAYYWRMERDYPAQQVPSPTILSFSDKISFDPQQQQQQQHQQQSEDSKKSSSTSSSSSKNSKKTRDLMVRDIEETLLSSAYQEIPRIVLSIHAFTLLPEKVWTYTNHTKTWAMDSIGDYWSYQEELPWYRSLPRCSMSVIDPAGSSWIARHAWYGEQVLQPKIAREIAYHSRSCNILFQFDYGNRSCFNKCK